ncbi:MAG: divalent cation transporter [Bacteroidetes bacterium]|nr:MAG: divalent cation transporter [Bacteroidota bacterium]
MILDLILYGGFAGITVLIGGILAHIFDHHMGEGFLKREISHTLMSFGAGIMLSALALVLVPKSLEKLDVLPLSLSFLGGAVLFMYIDHYLAKKGGQVSTLLAMMMDFIPESIALGAVFALDHQMAMLLAIFIGLQNLPEAFNAFRDLVKSGFTPQKTLLIFLFLSFFGIIGVLTGHFLLENSPTLTAYLMSFASGGILYLLVQDIVPESKMEKSYLTSMGATLGFLVGIIGEKVI